MRRPSPANSGGRGIDSTSSTRTSRLRLLSLAGSTLVSLSAGSNYAFSSFAPQLQDSVHLTSTQINVVGLAGNVGVYLSSPLWGKWVDKRGPRAALILGAALVLIGYWGLSVLYSSHLPASSSDDLHSLAHKSPRHPLTFPTVVLCNLLTGLGNSGAFTAAMNAQARSWGGDRRASATALVLSGFGLSAFFYSSLSHSLFPGNTQDYLRLLSIGSAASFLIGLFVIRILPPGAHPEGYTSVPIADEEDEGEEGASRAGSRRTSVSYLRRRTSSDLSSIAYARSSELSREDEDEEEEDALEAGSRPGPASAQHTSARSSSRSAQGSKSLQSGLEEDVTGLALLKRVDFILLFLIMTLISGAGLLLINNVGTITRTLWRYNHQKGKPSLGGSEDGWPLGKRADLVSALAKDDKAAVQQLQAHQVSAISIGNASGRILIGLAADFVVNRAGDSRLRVWLLVPVCALAILSQSLAAAPNTVTSIKMLLLVSASTGLMYGTLFGICPSLNLEFFGLKNFSQNWGYVSLSPVLAGNIFNLAFGRIYDSHVPTNSRSHECMDGEECYRSVFVLTTWCAVAATMFSFVLIFRRTGLPAWLAGRLQ